MNTKVVEIKGKSPGKTVSILVGVHGNEKCGINAVEKILSGLKIDKGMLYVIYCNLKAMDKNKRFIEENLNRCFLKEQPENLRESLEGKTAREIMPYLDRSDMALDLHASNTKESVPFIICEKRSFDVARALPVKIVSRNWGCFEPGGTDYYMNLQNKVGICVECGYLGDEKSTELAEKSILEFLKVAELIRGEPEQNEQEYIEVCDLYRNKFGKFRKVREFSDFELLGKGTLIGMDEDEEVRAGEDGFVLFVRDREKIWEECFLLARPTINIKTNRGLE